MNEPIDLTGPLTPQDREVLRQLGIAARALEIWSRRGEPGHVERAEELERTYRAAELVPGLLMAVEHFAALLGDPARYHATLLGWQMAAEVADALAPVFGDESAD